MATSTNDLSIVLSGGIANINPLNSIGGEASSYPVTSGVINNLFPDVTADQSEAGHEDYRCVYIFNDGEKILYNIKLWIFEDPDGGATSYLGIENRNEIQRLILTGTMTGGSISFSYLNGTVTFDSAYESDLSIWASQLQETLRSLTDDDDNLYFDDVEVLAQNSSNNTIIFDIKFVGINSRRNFETIVITENNLEPLNSIDANLTTTHQGAPVNTVAIEINVDTTPPGGVTFTAPTQSSPIIIPYLNPDDGFPLWIKRSVLENTDAVDSDYVRIIVTSSLLKPS